MENYTNEELIKALGVVSSTITKCEKMQGKFAEGTSQHTLLKNRIKAMYISKILIVNGLYKIEQKLDRKEEKSDFESKNIMELYTNEELTEALRPIVSIINKCKKAQEKFEEGNIHYVRFENIIKAMYVSKSLIEEQLSIPE